MSAATPAKSLDEHHQSPRSHPSEPKSFCEYTTPSPTDEECSKSLSGTINKKLSIDSTSEKDICERQDNDAFVNRLKQYRESSKDYQFKRDSEVNENKSIIDEKIYEILGLSHNPSVNLNHSWSYNAETLNELIRLKIEQEKTKQEVVKKEFTMLTIELMNLIKNLNLSNDLIAYIFLSDSLTNEELKNKIAQLTKLTTKDVESKKRKFSDSLTNPQLPSFTETTQNIRNSSNLVSPLRSPNNKSPISTSHISSHRRIISDSSDASSSGLLKSYKVQSPPQQQQQPPINQLPLPPPVQNPSTNYNSRTQSQQHSPTLPHQTAQVAPPLYPIYYQTPQMLAQQPPQQQSSQQTHENSTSPYQQKYPVVFPPNNANYQQVPFYVSTTSPPPPPPQGQSVPHPPAHFPQYVYQAQPPPSLPQTQPTSQKIKQKQKNQQSVPTHQFECPDNNKKSSEREGATTPTSGGTQSNSSSVLSSSKRHKGLKGGNSINFMITTPKNPPARKYNNPKEK